MVTRADSQTLKQKQIERYSDFNTTFEMNPFTGMLARATNEEAVKQSLRNIVLTECGERFYDSNKGSKIKQSLFELFDVAMYDVAKIQLRGALEFYEPRARIIDIEFGPTASDLDSNALRVKITFSVINIPGATLSLDLNVTRVR